MSSKVNQWTLLVGTLPIVFAISSASLHGLPIDAVQREELFLTAAQSFFAITVLINLRMSLREAGFLFGLFWVAVRPRAPWSPRACTGSSGSRWACVYLALGAWQLLQQRTEVRPLLHDGFRASLRRARRDAARRRRE